MVGWLKQGDGNLETYVLYCLLVCVLPLLGGNEARGEPAKQVHQDKVWGGGSPYMFLPPPSTSHDPLEGLLRLYLCIASASVAWHMVGLNVE